MTAVERARRWAATHKERLQAYRRQYFQKNKRALMEKAKAWKAEHPEAVKEYRERYKKKHPEAWKRHGAEGYLKYRFAPIAAASGMTLDALLAVWRAARVCLICNRAVSGRSRHLDHDHKSGKFRGILCNRCNGALGLFGDDLLVLRRAVCYLEDAARRWVVRPAGLPES